MRDSGQARSRRRPFILLLNLFLYPLFVLWTVLAVAMAGLVYAAARWVAGLGTARSARLAIWIYGRVWIICFWPLTRFAREGFYENGVTGPCIICANHLSIFDIYFMGGLPFYNVSFVVRSWPYRMFWHAPFMRLAGYINVEEMSAEEILVRGREVLDSGGNLVFYPEGHRSRDGQLGRFRSGAFKMAIVTGYPLVPVCLTGTDDLLPPGTKLMAPARVRMRALAPVDPAAFPGPTGHGSMRRKVKELMSINIQDMRSREGGHGRS